MAGRVSSTCLVGDHKYTPTLDLINSLFLCLCSGTIGCIWLVLWVWIVKEGPQYDKHISKEELDYIQNSIGDSSKMRDIRHPWKEIFKSPAVWAIVASHFSENWGFYTLLTNLPKFLKESLNFEVEKSGFISAIPYLTMGILLGVAGYLADWTQLKGYLTTTQVRRYFNCGAFIAQTICMILVAYLLDPTLSVLFISIGVGLGAFAWSGFAYVELIILFAITSIYSLKDVSNSVLQSKPLGCCTTTLVRPDGNFKHGN